MTFDWACCRTPAAAVNAGCFAIYRTRGTTATEMGPVIVQGAVGVDRASHGRGDAGTRVKQRPWRSVVMRRCGVST